MELDEIFTLLIDSAVDATLEKKVDKFNRFLLDYGYTLEKVVPTKAELTSQM